MSAFLPPQLQEEEKKCTPLFLSPLPCWKLEGQNWYFETFEEQGGDTSRL